MQPSSVRLHSFRSFRDLVWFGIVVAEHPFAEHRFEKHPFEEHPFEEHPFKEHSFKEHPFAEPEEHRA